MRVETRRAGYRDKNRQAKKENRRVLFFACPNLIYIRKISKVTDIKPNEIVI